MFGRRSWCIALMLAAAVSVRAQYAPGFEPPSSPSKRHYQPELSIRVLTEQEARAWTKEKWRGDNRPFQQIRNELSAAKAKGGLSFMLLGQYKALAQQNPSDPVVQFRWGYAAWLMINSTTGGSKLYDLMYGVREGLGRASSPHTYDYARLRFIIEGYHGYINGLADVGERLAAYDPNDYSVIYALTSVLDSLPGMEMKRKALHYAQTLVQLKPNLPYPYSAVGSVYQRMWEKTHDKSYADKAITGYQKYLEIAPASYTWRPMAERIIKVIQMEEAEQQAKANPGSGH